MKICAIICEYNPFHNGHLHQLEEAKRLSGADAILCVMSGNFVQRGEQAILDKFIRARHAILAGADAVIELPTVFATSNAELFAKGAVKLLSSIPAVDTLCFGAETADKRAFLHATALLNDEPKEISSKIKKLVKEGASYAKARATAWENTLPEGLLTSPNNILGVEYARAISAQNAQIELLPIPRVGAGYKEENLQGKYSSATAIREAIRAKADCQNALPDFVKKDLPDELSERLESLEKYAILRAPAEQIARTCDCTEGLEHAFKKACFLPQTLTESLTSPRYTSARIRRIALQNLLGIEEGFLRDCLSAPLYLRLLAVKKARTEVLSALSESTFPLLARPRDEERLTGDAKASYEKDLFAESLYSILRPSSNKIDIFV